MDPMSSKGAIHLILMGMGAVITALLIGQFIPSIIPARATSVRI